MPEIMKFRTMGEATVTVELDKCGACRSKACVEACSKPHMGNILELDGEGKPRLLMEKNKVKRGGCTDCLACELDCRLYGKGALKISLEMPYLEEHLRQLTERGEKIVYRD